MDPRTFFPAAAQGPLMAHGFPLPFIRGWVFLQGHFNSIFYRHVLVHVHVHGSFFIFLYFLIFLGLWATSCVRFPPRSLRACVSTRTSSTSCPSRSSPSRPWSPKTAPSRPRTLSWTHWRARPLQWDTCLPHLPTSPRSPSRNSLRHNNNISSAWRHRWRQTRHWVWCVWTSDAKTWIWSCTDPWNLQNRRLARRAAWRCPVFALENSATVRTKNSHSMLSLNPSFYLAKFNFKSFTCAPLKSF